MGVLTRLKAPTGVSEKDKRPVGTVGVLLFSIIAGIHNQGVVHHGARTFRNGLQGFHQLDQHLAVVLPDLCPNTIARLVDMPKPMTGIRDTQSFPGPEILTASGGNG